MNKIAIFTMGTRGDVQPYIYLARSLTESGIDTIIGTHPCWKNLIEEAGVGFKPIGPDINIERETAEIRGNSLNPLLSMLKSMDFITEIIQESTHDILNACKGRDLVVVSHSLMGAVEAEVLGIPTVNVTLQKDTIGEKLRQQTFLEKGVDSVISQRVAKPYNKIRKIYGLRPIKSSDELVSDNLNLIPISRSVIERNPYWEAKNVVTGFWYYDDPDFIPNERLEHFMEVEKQVLLYLGTLENEDDADLVRLDTYLDAFEETNTKVIIMGAQGKFASTYDLPEWAMTCDYLPPSWLFAKARYIIHNCGFATSVASLVYGAPSVPIPNVLDQIGYATKLYDLGVATKAVQGSKVSYKSLLGALDEMNSSYYFKKESAEELAKKVRSENGLGEAVRLIKDVLRG